MIKNYLKTAIRNLLRNRVYSLINVLGLSLGLASAMLIVLYVKDEVSYDRFHPGVGQLYRIYRQTVNPDGSIKGEDGYTGYPQGPVFGSAVPEIKGFVRLRDGYRNIQTGNTVSGVQVKNQPVLYADPNFFSVFAFPLLRGNPQTALSQPGGVVISEEMAKNQFGTTDAMGKMIMLKGDSVFEPYVVTGIARNSPQNSSIKFQVLLPLKVPVEEAKSQMQWFNNFLSTFIVLKPGANPAVVEEKCRKIFIADAADAIKEAREKYDFKATVAYKLQRFTDIHLSKELPISAGLSDGSNAMYGYILSGIALFILLIACINFVNLTVARSVRRAKEIGIRKVSGGGRRELAIQFLGESFLLCLLAFGLALLLVQLVLPVFNELSDKALAFSYLLDTKLVLGYIGLFGITGLLAGIYPAWVLSGFNPVQTLYGRYTPAGKHYLQKTLVVVQFALASFLIVGTLTIFAQFDYLTHKKLGYDDRDLLRVNVGGMKRVDIQTLKTELLKSPDVAGVAAKNGGGWYTSAKVNGETQLTFAVETVDEAYVPLIKVPLVAGRWFSAAFPSDSATAVVVNEALVKAAGWKDPIGQVVNFWYFNKQYRVVGVTKDYHYNPLSEAIRPQLFTMNPANGFGNVYVKIRPHSETASLRFVEKTFKNLAPMSPFIYSFKNEENRNAYLSEAKWKQIILFGAILTIFISGIGLFGLSVLSAEKRTKEIGVRKVLGASVRRVVVILSKDFLALVGIALVVSMPLAWLAVNKWLEGYPYRITVGWGLFVMTGVLVILIALATVSIQAVRTAMANPVKSLRAE